MRTDMFLRERKVCLHATTQDLLYYLYQTQYWKSILNFCTLWETWIIIYTDNQQTASCGFEMQRDASTVDFSLLWDTHRMHNHFDSWKTSKTAFTLLQGPASWVLVLGPKRTWEVSCALFFMMIFKEMQDAICATLAHTHCFLWTCSRMQVPSGVYAIEIGSWTVKVSVEWKRHLGAQMPKMAAPIRASLLFSGRMWWWFNHVYFFKKSCPVASSVQEQWEANRRILCLQSSIDSSFMISREGFTTADTLKTAKFTAMISKLIDSHNCMRQNVYFDNRPFEASSGFVFSLRSSLSSSRTWELWEHQPDLSQSDSHVTECYYTWQQTRAGSLKLLSLQCCSKAAFVCLCVHKAEYTHTAVLSHAQ